MNTALNNVRHVPPSPGARPGGDRFFQTSPHTNPPQKAVGAIPLPYTTRITATSSAFAANWIT